LENEKKAFFLQFRQPKKVQFVIAKFDRNKTTNNKKQKYNRKYRNKNINNKKQKQKIKLN